MKFPEMPADGPAYAYGAVLHNRGAVHVESAHCGSTWVWEFDTPNVDDVCMITLIHTLFPGETS